MGITYRQSNGQRLSVQQMDDNFHYIEQQLAGLTSSNSGTGATGPTGPQGATGPAGFGATGGISFPYLPGNQRTGSGDNLQFEKGSVYQKIISTADGTESAPTVERLVISGGDSYQDGPTYSGEGGDIYLWAGKGQDGGDIKVDAGNGISSGGTIKVRGGFTETGTGGFVEISAGQSIGGSGGNVTVAAGEGSSAGGNLIFTAGRAVEGGGVYIYSGYGDNISGDISLNAGYGGSIGGHVNIVTGGAERMRVSNDGKIGIGTTDPTVALDIVGSMKADGGIFNSNQDTPVKIGGDFVNSEGGIYTLDNKQIATYDAGEVLTRYRYANGTIIIDNDDNGGNTYKYTTIDGKFGINTTPSVALDVVGDIHMNGNEVQTVKYKVYTAILEQVGTASPTATVLENTLGFTPVWNRTSPGLYFLSSIDYSQSEQPANDGFPLEKTVVFFCKNHFSSNTYDFYVDNEDTSSNDIFISTIQSGSSSDDLMLRTPIEIRVYN